ncbi:MAG: preprotein translocase subunit SecE [Alphaproteobacteria bacterium]|nr:preprotein translocase subunit SecE [Alphaproteobacteria bacterium]
MKVSPALFVRQVKQEISKITWPTRSETGMGTVVVIILCLIMAVFLFLVDSIFAGIVRWVMEA